MKLKWFNVLLILSFVFNSSCASGLIKVSYLDNYAGLIEQDLDLTGSNKSKLIQKMEAFKSNLGNYQQPLTLEDYDKIISELTPIIAEIKRFKQSETIFPKDQNAIVLPAKSKLTLDLNTYCLSPHNAAPSPEEPYVLTSETPDIPLYAEVMSYTRKNKVDRGIKQSLIWNLKNDVKFEDLPLEQQKLLLEIDPASPLKINNFLKEEAKKQAAKLLEKYIPQIGKAKDIVEVVKGKVYKYEDYARRIESLKSKYKKPSNDKPIKAEGYGNVSTIVDASGYSKATVTFINTSDQPQEIHSYFKPLRKDVQPLGFDLPDYYDFYGEIDKEYESLAQKIFAIIKFLHRPGDFKTVKENPDRLIDIARGLWDACKSENRTMLEFGRSVDDDISNAFKHAYWNALMTRDIGYDFAKEIAANHELNPGSKPQQTEMDLYNNQIGRGIANRLIRNGISDDVSLLNEILKNQKDLKTLK